MNQQFPSDDKPSKRPFRENLEHFYEYYRYHVLFVVLAVVLAGYITHTVIENRREQAELAKLPPPAVTAMFFGEVPMFMEEEPLEDYILTLFPEWERAEAIVAYAPNEFKSELDFAMLQRSVATLSIEYADVYIMDDHNFNIYAPQGYFLPLDEIESELLNSVGEERLVRAADEVMNDEDDREGITEEHVYGLNIRGSDWFSGTQIADKDMIIAVRTNVENEENSLELIRKLAEGLGEK